MHACSVFEMSSFRKSPSKPNQVREIKCHVVFLAYTWGEAVSTTEGSNDGKFSEELKNTYKSCLSHKILFVEGLMKSAQKDILAFL